MTLILPYAAALARVREVLEFHRAQPRILPRSFELEDCTRDVARSAPREEIALATLLEDLRQLAAETLTRDPRAAAEAARAMARWAADENHTVVGWLTDGEP